MTEKNSLTLEDLLVINRRKNAQARRDQALAGFFKRKRQAAGVAPGEKPGNPGINLSKEGEIGQKIKERWAKIKQYRLNNAKV